MTRSIAVTMHHHSWLSLISRNRSSSLGCLLHHDISTKATTDQSSDHLRLWPPHCLCHLSLPPAPPRPLTSSQSCPVPAPCVPQPAANRGQLPAVVRSPSSGRQQLAARRSPRDSRLAVCGTLCQPLGRHFKCRLDGREDLMVPASPVTPCQVPAGQVIV